MTVCGTLHSQNYTLPTVLFDSMVFEVNLGRSCAKLQTLQKAEILRVTTELSATGRAVTLLESENRALHANAAALGEQLKDSQALGRVEKQRASIKLKRLWRVVVIESGALTVLVLLLI